MNSPCRSLSHDEMAWTQGYLTPEPTMLNCLLELLSDQLQALSSKKKNKKTKLSNVPTWHWAGLLEDCLGAFRWIWEIKALQKCLETRPSTGKQGQFLFPRSVTQAVRLWFVDALCRRSFHMCLERLFLLSLCSFPSLYKYLQWLM